MIININDGTLKMREGRYIIYDVDYLLKNLAREIYLLEEYRSMKERFEKFSPYEGPMQKLVEMVEKRKKELGYKGCKNCLHRIESLRTCEWNDRGGDGSLHLICPRWEKQGEHRP